MNLENQLKCENCQTLHDGTYGSGRFCQQKCSRSFATKSKRKEINEKVSKSLAGRCKPGVSKVCPVCGKDFSVKYGKRHQITCGLSCSPQWRYNCKDNPQRLSNLANARENGKKSAAVQRHNRRSKNEILFYKMCKENFGNVLNNTPMFNGWDADVILPDIKVAVMWNGRWHYEEIMEGTSLKQIQNRDRIKIKEIEAHGYTPYVIKDMGKYDQSFVESEFENFKKYISKVL